MTSFETFVNKYSDEINKDDFVKDFEKVLNEHSILTILIEMSSRLKEMSLKNKINTSLGPFASASAKKYAESKNLNVIGIEGTGKNKKITKKDLMNSIGDTGSKKSAKELQNERHQCVGKADSGGPCVRPGIYKETNNQWFCGFHYKHFD